MATNCVVYADINSFSFERFTNGATIQVREILRRLVARGAACGIVTTADRAGAMLHPRSADAVARQWTIADGVSVLDIPIDGSQEDAPDDHFNAMKDALDVVAPNLVVVNTPPLRLSEAETKFFEWLSTSAFEVLCFVPDANFPTPRRTSAARLARLRAALSRVTLAAPSAFIAACVRDELGLEARPFPNLFDERRIVARQTDRDSARRVTFINPHPMKGLAVMESLAAARPDITFQFVKSWPYPPIFTPKHANVETVPFNPDMRPLWSRTSALAVPSLCREAFGRVVVEAQLNGIPVVFHDIGGLREAACGAGVALTVPPFHGSPVFPKLTPNDLDDAVRRWSDALDSVFAAQPDRGAIREAGRRHLRDSETAFDAWAAPFGEPARLGPLLAVAPHSDDAAFSLAGFLAERDGDGVLATLFSRSGYTAAQGLDGDPCQVTAKRIAEDEAFGRAVGATVETVPLPEAALRHPGGFEGIFAADDTPGAAAAREAAGLVARVEHAFGRLIDAHAPRIMLLPLGLGGHRDHLLARDVGLQIALRRDVAVAFYEDLPYASACGDADIAERATMLGCTTPFLVPCDTAAKLDLCRLYDSQIDAQNLTDIESHGRRLGGAERLWPLGTEPALLLGSLS